MAGHLVEFTNGNFQSEVLASPLPVLVDFTAPWCPPCRAIAPMINELAAEYAGAAKIGKLNIDDNQRVAAQFNVHHIPALLIFQNGQLVDRFVGVQPKSRLRAALDAAQSPG